MDTGTQTAILSKPEVQQTVSRLREELGRALPEGSFAEREAAMLVVLGEVGRTLLEHDPPSDVPSGGRPQWSDGRSGRTARR